MGEVKPSTVVQSGVNVVQDVVKGVANDSAWEGGRLDSSIAPALSQSTPEPAPQHMQKHSIDRRRFIGNCIRAAGLAAATASLVPTSALAMLTAPATPRRLKFYNLHTSEQLDIVYFEKGRYIPQALAEIDYILRDYRQNVVKPMSPALLDLVVAMRRKLHTDAEVAIISGYRTPETNAMLAARSDGVAHHSLHMDGLALDWRVPGRTLEQLHQVALAMRGGGVGYYPSSDFVHVDVGRVRYW
jgi:uncharacterized protein YcbK (DUF882 family)